MAFPGRLYRQGSVLKIENVADPAKLFFVEQFGFNNFLDNEILGWIDTLAQVGANGMRVFGIWPFAEGNEQEPYVKVGNSFDLDQFNEAYFEHVRTWVTYAYNKGIAVLFEIFDSCGIFYEPTSHFNPFYQLVGTDRYAFSDLNNTRLVGIQRRFIEKLVETMRPDIHTNVIFGVMNEYQGDKYWHYEMSSLLKRLAPNTLISGCTENSSALDDPNVDIWFVHVGSYDLNTGTSKVRQDMDDLRNRAGNQVIQGYSTDGFGQAGKFRENPADMRSLAIDVLNNGVQLFGFLDHKAYNALGGGSVSQLNVETYQAIVDVFHPNPAPSRGPQYKLDAQSFVSLQKNNVPANILTQLHVLENQEYLTQEEFLLAVEAVIGKDNTSRYTRLLLQYADIDRLPDGYLDVFAASRLPSTHPEAIVERGGKAIRATTTQGFLCYGQYKTGYPVIPLQVLFSIFIDNNTADDRNILIVDVYDHHSDRVIGKRLITRKDFPKSNEFSLFTLNFTPPSSQANMEFRVYYVGWSYILIDKIAVIDPSVVTVTQASDIPNPQLGDGSQTPSPGTTPSTGNLVIDDPLTTGTSVGVVTGGDFRSGGYTMTATSQGYLLYETTITKNIRIEFDAEGYIDLEPMIGDDDNFTVMMMYDSDPYANWFDRAIWELSPYYLFQIRKLGGGPGAPTPNAIAFKTGSLAKGADQTWASWVPGHCLAGNPIDWNPSTRYHWVINVSHGHTDIIRNDVKLFSVDTGRAFDPDNRIVVSLGGAPFGSLCARNVTYSNVKIYQL